MTENSSLCEPIALPGQLETNLHFDVEILSKEIVEAGIHETLARMQSDVSDDESLTEENYSYEEGSSSDDFQKKKPISPLSALTFPPPPPAEDEIRSETEAHRKAGLESFLLAEFGNAADLIVLQAIHEVVLIETIVSSAISDAIKVVHGDQKHPVIHITQDDKEEDSNLTEASQKDGSETAEGDQAAAVIEVPSADGSKSSSLDGNKPSLTENITSSSENQNNSDDSKPDEEPETATEPITPENPEITSEEQKIAEESPSLKEAELVEQGEENSKDDAVNKTIEEAEAELSPDTLLTAPDEKEQDGATNEVAVNDVAIALEVTEQLDPLQKDDTTQQKQPELLDQKAEQASSDEVDVKTGQQETLIPQKNESNLGTGDSAPKRQDPDKKSTCCCTLL